MADTDSICIERSKLGFYRSNGAPLYQLNKRIHTRNGVAGLIDIDGRFSRYQLQKVTGLRNTVIDS